jgi:hypothetical protein
MQVYFEISDIIEKHKVIKKELGVLATIVVIDPHLPRSGTLSRNAGPRQPRTPLVLLRIHPHSFLHNFDYIRPNILFLSISYLINAR